LHLAALYAERLFIKEEGNGEKSDLRIEYWEEILEKGWVMIMREEGD
jgi:hypothetical protein